MKSIIKFILSFICYLLFIPGVIISTIGITWNTLPGFQTTSLGMLLNNLTENNMVLITIIVGTLTILLGIFGKIFNVIKKSKTLNFYTHFITWMVALTMVIEACYSFIASENIHIVDMDLNIVRKIGIIACVLGIILYTILSPKLKDLVNRRILAYDTAKELNANGRSSIIGMQILKCFDLIFPEIFLLLALCFAFNYEVSLYFIYIIIAFIIPIIGNIICDKRVRKEAIATENEKQEAQINATAEAVADLIRSNGDNF